MFKLLETTKLEALNIEFFKYEHEKTKAKHIHIKADDKNNGFFCALRTVPSSNNGIMHILEHCVLQGSKNFDLKDVFTAVNKKSLNTFMNAMTGPSITMFPFTTQTKKDFDNLFAVFNDAVFFPNLSKEAFLQEGWRFEFEDPKDENSKLKLNGVVFNEMLGLEGSAYRQAVQEIGNNLYPDTCYAYDSGGIPQDIPSLSYEEFIAYHKKFYHPSNAIFVTYGDIEASYHQEKLEEVVLSKFDYSPVLIENLEQKEFKKPAETKVIEYPYQGDDFENKNFFVKSFAAAELTSIEDMFTLEMFNALISGDSSSIFNKAADDANIASESFAYYTDYFSKADLHLGFEDIRLENVEQAEQIINDVLLQVAENGFDEETILKELHQFELSQKSKFQRIDNAAFHIMDKTIEAELFNAKISDILNPIELFENLKKNLKDPEFIKNFVKEKIINNPHQSSYILKASPEKALANKQALAKIIEDKTASLTAEDKAAILKDMADLEAYQNRIDDPKYLPDLSVSDIEDFYNPKTVERRLVNGKNIAAFTVPTGGVALTSRVTFIKDLKASQGPYLNIYATLFNNLGFGQYTYDQAVSIESNLCDSININFSLVEDKHDPNKIYVRGSVGSKMLLENIEKVKELTSQKITSLRLDEKKTIIQEIKKWNSANSHSLNNKALNYAIDLSKTKLSKLDNFSFNFSSFGFAIFLKDLAENIDNDDVYNDFIDNISKINELVIASFEKYNLVVLDSKESIDNTLAILDEENVIEETIRHPIDYDIKDTDANIIVHEDTSANYCVMTAPAPYIDHELSGPLLVLTKIIEGEYTHVNIREKAGAYGGYASYNPHSETFGLMSYRDPNISKTFDIFKDFGNWLNNVEISDKQLEEGILQSISMIDSPSSEISKCSSAIRRFYNQQTEEELIKFRDGILSTDIAKIKLAITQVLLPSLQKANFAALANKQQYKNEGLNLKTLEL